MGVGKYRDVETGPHHILQACKSFRLGNTICPLQRLVPTESFDIPATLVTEAIEGVQKTGEFKTDSYRMLNRQKNVEYFLMSIFIFWMDFF